ncbi:MAG: hypothetical protein M0Q92_09380 [Methanoregula sp.]|jgi:hypothetical protein|nr:hypothetical protein [Methanoregula sp.]
MPHNKEPGSAWRHTTVLVRADIYTKAQDQGIDISDACNRALADLLGIDYRQQHLDAVPVPPPVIIASDGGIAAPAGTTGFLHKPSQPPVINADDPKAPGTIATIKKQPVKKPAPPPTGPEIPVKETRSTQAAVKTPAAAPATKARKPAPKKAEKGDVLKKFIAAMIVRADTDDAVIPKEDLYQIFSRWCREQKISPVPEAKQITVALKNKLAFREKSVGGKPCWTNVRLKD